MRSAKDSDDDVEEKAGAGRLRTQLHTIQSPLRRSTRLKQNKCSPGSESDSSSVSNSRNRTRTATIDSTVSDTIMKLRTRKPSVSSDISEISEIDVGSPPKKRITRQSLNAPATPTRVNTRAASKRLIRAVSEAYSPSPVTRSRRSSRASSVDPEFSVDKSKGRPETPVKTRKRATVLPSSSLAKEQLELKDRIPYVRLDATIIEADEITNSGNSDSSSKKELHLPKNQTKKRQSIDNEVEADDSHGNSDSSPGKTLHLPKSLQIKKRQSIDKDEAETDDCHGNWGSSPDKTLHLPKSPQIQKLQSIDKEEAEADDSHGNSDSSPGKTLHLPKSPQIKKRQSINKDEAEADNSHENSNSSPEIFTLLWRKSPQIKKRQSIDKDEAEADDSYENSGSSPDKTLHLPKSPQIQKRQSIDKDEADDNHGNLDSSQKEIIALHLLESQKIKKHQSVDKEVEDDSDEDDEKLKTLTDSSKDEAFQLVEREDWIQVEDMDSATVKNTDNILAEEEDKLGKCPSFNNSIIEISSSCSSSPQSFAKEDQTKIAEENPSNVEKSIVNIHKLEVAENEFEKLVDTSSEEQKSDKENEMLNINSDVSIEKNRLPILISSVSCGMSALPFMNESLNEKETKLLKRAELLSRRRRSRESIEMKHDNLSKKVADDSQEKMDISTEFLTSTTNVTVLSQHDMYSPKLVEKVINKDETSNENISKSTTEMSSESVKINEKEYTVIDNKNSHKIESDKMSRSSINLVESTQIENKDNNGQSRTFIPTTDDNNEIRLEEQNSHQDENEVPSPCKFDQSKDMRISSPANKNSDDQIIIQDKITESSDSIKEKQEQQDLSKCTKLALEFSNTTLELNNSVRNDSNNIVIQDDQSSDVTETSKKSGLDLSPEKTDAKDILPEKIVKQNLKRNSTDVLNGREREKEHSQMELCQKYVVNNIEISNDSDDSDVEGLKSLFQNVPVHGNKSPLKNAEDIKAARNLDEGYDFEPTSDDERLVKSRLDVVDEELMDIDNEEIENRFKGEKAKIYRRITTLDEESLERIEDEDNSKAVNELKTSLNDRKSFGLNKSGQLTRTSERSFKTINESDKEIEDDTTKLNRSLLINKKNTSLRSLGERTSTNNFSRDTSMQNASINKFRIDDSEEELDNTDVHAGKKLYKKKRSLNKSRKEDADDDTIESEKTVSTKDSSQTNKNTLRKYLNRSIDQKSKPVDTKMTLDLYADKSDSDKSVTTNLGSKTSMIANVGSHMSDEDSNDESNCCDRSYKFAKAISDIDSSSDAADNRNNSNDNSSDSDIIREYNLNGVDPKYEDDFDIYGQLCRASETESSDSSDNGSDLADFIVDDVEDEEEKEEDMEDKESSEQDVEINFETIHKDKVEDENKFAETKADISDKIHKDRNKYLSYKSDTEMKRNKMTCSMEKNAETILDSSNSELSSKKKKKSLTKENDNILLDASNSISSLSKKKRKSDPQYSSRDEAERDSNELNKSESLSAKKPKSYESMKFSTPIYSSMTLELDEIFKRISKDKDIKRDNAIETIQNTSTKKKSSINPTNEDISSNNAISSNELSPDLLKLLEKTSFLKSTSSKMNLRKTMSIVDSETPTLKHLRKEKLNDSAPILKLNTETISTKKLSVGKDTVQIKEKNNDKVSELIMLSNDDAIQRYSEKKQKKRKKGDRSKEDIIDETLSEDLNVSKKKNNKDKVPELIMLSNDDAIQRYSEKKQKKRKKGDRSKEDIIDEALSEDLNVPKKKNNKDKVPELIMLSNDDAIQRYSEKKQKKRKKGDRSKEDIIDEVLSEDLNVPKKIKRIKLTHLSTRDDNLCEDPYQIEEKKKKKKKKQDTLREYIVDKALFENATELKIPKKKKLVKPTQLIIDDNIWEDVCQINEKPKKKKKKQDTLREYIADKTLFEDATELKIPKKKKSVKLTQLTNDNIGKDASISTKKKKMQDSTKESIIDEALPHDAVVLKIPKIEKRAKLDKLAITKTNICKSAYETKKEKKKKKEIKKNIIEKTLSEDTTELKMPKMKKRAKLDKLAITEDNIYKSAYQVEKEKKEKKGKTKENISEKALSEDAIELKISKKKKHANIDKLATVQDNAHENAYQINEKKKKKKKQINVTEEDENVNEDNILRKKTRENKTGLEQKKKKKIVNSLKLSSPTDKHVTKKKIKQQETVKSIETLWMEKKDTLPVQIPVSKLIKTSDKNLSHKRIQKPILDKNESKYIVCTSKKPDKAIAKMYVSEELRIPKELKLKKKRIGMEDIENTKKSKKEVKEVTKSLPSSRGLKRLPDYVIENLSDVPTRQKKKRKISRNEDKVLPIKMNKSKAMTKDYDDSFTLSTSGSTNTQFHLVNLQNTKKQPLHGTAAAISFRQRMLAKNERKPISIYSTYRKKMNLE